MKTHIVQDDPSPSGAPPAAVTDRPAAWPPPGDDGSRRPPPPGRTGRRLLLGSGGVAIMLPLALLATGTIGLRALGQRDGDGYFTTGDHRLATPSSALATDRLQIDADAPRWVFGERFATSRIQARSDQPVFVGIGPSDDVERYLRDVRHAQIDDVDMDPFRVTSHLAGGNARPAPPAREGFWRVQSSGSGTQTVRWPLEAGRWSAVVMNADGSPDVAVDARFGARVPFLEWIAVGLLAAGVVVLLAGAGLLRLGARPRGVRTVSTAGTAR